MKALDIYDYTPEALQAFPLYPANDYADPPEIKAVELKFFGDKTFASYEYDKDSDKLLRSTRGKEHKDASNGEQLAVQNVIIQYVHEDVYKRQAQDRAFLVLCRLSGRIQFKCHARNGAAILVNLFNLLVKKRLQIKADCTARVIVAALQVKHFDRMGRVAGESIVFPCRGILHACVFKHFPQGCGFYDRVRVCGKILVAGHTP